MKKGAYLRVENLILQSHMTKGLAFTNCLCIFQGVFTDAKTIEELNDQITSRMFTIWHDHSTVGSHSHFLVLLSLLYDPLVYLTPTEYKESRNRWVWQQHCHAMKSTIGVNQGCSAQYPYWWALRRLRNWNTAGFDYYNYNHHTLRPKKSNLSCLVGLL